MIIAHIHTHKPMLNKSTTTLCFSQLVESPLKPLAAGTPVGSVRLGGSLRKTNASQPLFTNEAHHTSYTIQTCREREIYVVDDRSAGTGTMEREKDGK